MSLLERKGNLSSIRLVIISVFTLTVTVLVSQLILSEVLAATGPSMIDQGILKSAQASLQLFDYGIVAVNLFFYIVGFILASKVRSDPVYLFPGLLILAVNAWFSSVIANIYSLIIGQTIFAEVAQNMTLTSYMFQNWPLTVIVLGGIWAVILYAKSVNQSERITR